MRESGPLQWRSSGHFYFAGIGHFYFAPTPVTNTLAKPSGFHYALSVRVRRLFGSKIGDGNLRIGSGVQYFSSTPIAGEAEVRYTPLYHFVTFFNLIP